jgi:hypothetical protein
MMDGDSSASRGLVRASSECIVDKAAALLDYLSFGDARVVQ